MEKLNCNYCYLRYIISLIIVIISINILIITITIPIHYFNSLFIKLFNYFILSLHPRGPFADAKLSSAP